ncbi:LysR family transcriptional regulator [Thalassotalea insulae]|uniref:LysR family transcriptional regulator n=1 Tax=Thalassotalea insulae TaxID=2056778 RepID=A0ABQ6GV99_9GAMM|nr:LysR family transcriptional regulator [Thalassotalea insulae]GLX79279.1 LysR family transcriptional regulator [Thalassotalea insulae]
MIGAIEHYLFFTAIVEQGSITKAAQHLGLPKSKLSRRLALLEQQLGTQLLNRTTRNQVLTESGRLLYNNCKPHIDALTDAQTLVTNAISVVKGKLNLLLPLEFFNKVISSLITDFAISYPEIEIHCHHYSQSQPPVDYQYDLVFVLHEQALPSSNWIGRTLLSFPQSIYIAQASKLPLFNEIADISLQSAIFSSEQEQWLFRVADEFKVVTPKQVMVLSSPEMRVEACQRGIGMIKLPDYIGKNNTLLRPVNLKHHLVAQQLTLMYQNRNIPAKTRIFLDYFQSKIGRLS